MKIPRSLNGNDGDVSKQGREYGQASTTVALQWEYRTNMRDREQALWCGGE